MPEVQNMIEVPEKSVSDRSLSSKIYTPVAGAWTMNLAHETAQERKYDADDLLALRAAVRYHIDFLHIRKQRD